MRSDSDPLADLIELQPAWVKSFDLPGGDGAYWTVFPNSDSVEIRAEMIQPTVNLWSFGVWYWPEALAVALALLVLVTGRWWWFARRGKEPRCRKCGYELTGLKSEACPECGAALTPRNRVTGLRSRWRMALAPAALLLIGGAWWFGEGRVPRIGWVSEMVELDWAVHRGSIFPSDFSSYHYPWYQRHGRSRAHHVVIDRNGHMVRRMVHAWLSRFSDAERVWGRFPGSDTAWEFDERSGEYLFYHPDDTITVVSDLFCGNFLGWSDENRVTMEVDGVTVTHTFLPDHDGDGWFILADGRLTHRSFTTGKLSDVHQFERAYDSGYPPNWYMLPVAGGHYVVIYESLSDEMFLVDLESRTVIDRITTLHAGPEEAMLLAIGHMDSPLRDDILGLWLGQFEPLILTRNNRYIVHRTLTASMVWHWRIGDLKRGKWMYHVKMPQQHRTYDVQITTGPGPRDVNVFYIDGGQLILAVYEIPEAE